MIVNELVQYELYTLINGFYFHYIKKIDVLKLNYPQKYLDFLEYNKSRIEYQKEKYEDFEDISEEEAFLDYYLSYAFSSTNELSEFYEKIKIYKIELEKNKEIENEKLEEYIKNNPFNKKDIDNTVRDFQKIFLK